MATYPPASDFDPPRDCPGCSGPDRPAHCLTCGAHFYPEVEDDYGDGGEWESCCYCGGAGGFHDCGEDCCACAEPELDETCPECEGEGGWYV